MTPQEIEKTLALVSKVIGDQEYTDLWRHFTAYGILFAFVNEGADLHDYLAAPAKKLTPLEEEDMAPLALKVVAHTLGLERNAASGEAVVAAFKAVSDYVSKLENEAHRMTTPTAEGLFKSGFEFFKKNKELTLSSEDGGVALTVTR